MILLIDHYDSFTYNLVQALGQQEDILVKRHDELSIDIIEHLSPEYIVVSSGPGRPKADGITMEAIHRFSGRVPILGVGLGCHAIAEAFGGKIIKAERLLSGKSVDIYHDGKTIFTGMAQPFSATRYHSLAICKESLPNSLKVSAWSREKEIMAIRHADYPIEGVLFNPESILTEAGDKLLKNFIENNRVAAD